MAQIANLLIEADSSLGRKGEGKGVELAYETP